MSVITTFDKTLDDAIEHIKSAKEEILKCLDSSIYGYETIEPDYIRGLHEINTQLFDILTKL